MTKSSETPESGAESPAAAPQRVCAICGGPLVGSPPTCTRCSSPVLTLDVRRTRLSPLPPREMELVPEFDRLLLLAALLAFVSLYLPWLPGVYGSVPGWKVPYATADIPLDEIRHLEEVARPETLFLVNFVGIIALAFCRTSRHAGIRDLVATVILVVGGGYFLVYFAQQWGWCLGYNYVGPYATFASLGLVVLSGLLRPKFMPWAPLSKVLMLLASAFLLTGLFLPWSLDYTGVALMFAVREFYWIGVPRVFAYLMPIFPLLGFVGFILAFREIPGSVSRFWRCWPVCFGIAALVYFRVMWATYLVGWPLGSWGILLGLTMLTVSGFLDAFPERPFLARLLMWAFLVLNSAVWLSFLTGGLWAVVRDFFSPPPWFF